MATASLVTVSRTGKPTCSTTPDRDVRLLLGGRTQKLQPAAGLSAICYGIAMRQHREATVAASEARQSARDFAKICDAIRFIVEQGDEEPRPHELAMHLGLDTAGVDRLLQRWCGLERDGFVRAIAAKYVRTLLAGSAGVLDRGAGTCERRGGPFVTQGVLHSGAAGGRGAGLEIAYDFHATPFGEALLLVTLRGLVGLAFVNEDALQTRAAALGDMTRRWPAARFVSGAAQTRAIVSGIFDPEAWSAMRPLQLLLIGTEFEIRVWKALLAIPLGRAVTYADIARHLGQPTAARAVGSAVGRNPISFVVPCHCVLRGDGALGGYHWGLTRKRALLCWEAGRGGTSGAGSMEQGRGRG